MRRSQGIYQFIHWFSFFKRDALAIDDNIQHASEDIKRKSKEIVKYRKLMKNASAAIDQISICIPVLENYTKLQDLMAQKKWVFPNYLRLFMF